MSRRRPVSYRYRRRPTSGAVPAEFAAWVEKEFDTDLHALADGSGRTTRLVSATVLARYGLFAPRYPGKTEYYDLARRPAQEWVSTYRRMLAESQDVQ